HGPLKVTRSSVAPRYQAATVRDPSGALGSGVLITARSPRGSGSTPYCRSGAIPSELAVRPVIARLNAARLSVPSSEARVSSAFNGYELAQPRLYPQFDGSCGEAARALAAP